MNERMITHRKYLGIVMLMLVLLFMFMFTAVARESISEYDVNEYAIRQAASGESRWLPYAARDGIRKAQAGKTEAGRAILLFGSLDNSTQSGSWWWKALPAAMCWTAKAARRWCWWMPGRLTAARRPRP